MSHRPPEGRDCRGIGPLATPWPRLCPALDGGSQLLAKDGLLILCIQQLNARQTAVGHYPQGLSTGSCAGQMDEIAQTFAFQWASAIALDDVGYRKSCSNMFGSPFCMAIQHDQTEPLGFVSRG